MFAAPRKRCRASSPHAPFFGKREVSPSADGDKGALPLDSAPWERNASPFEKGLSENFTFCVFAFVSSTFLVKINLLL